MMCCILLKTVLYLQNDMTGARVKARSDLCVCEECVLRCSVLDQLAEEIVHTDINYMLLNSSLVL